MSDPFQVVRDFESALCEYTGARFAVTTTSCTMALLLALAWHRHKGAQDVITLPARTYVGVPMSAIHAGFKVMFANYLWAGSYRLRPLPVYDCARRLTSGMYRPAEFQCLSFHWGKILGLGQGGAILHDSPEADFWLRRARFDGRTEGLDPGEDNIAVLGWHCYMTPETAAQGRVRLGLLPRHNKNLPNSDYPYLPDLEVFRDRPR